MAIYQRNRGFQAIIDELEVNTIPIRFVRELICFLKDGRVFEFKRFETVDDLDTDLETFLKALDFFDELADLKIHIDYEKVEIDVNDQVTEIFKKVNHDQGNSSM
jgi:hypothetical protein